MSGLHHVTESVSDRKKKRELAEARQSGTAAPEVDVKTGNMINPHNPEFITKRPWYLGSSEVSGPSLDHQTTSLVDKERNVELSVSAADQLVRDLRKKKKKWKVGLWVEAKRNNQYPYQICRIKSVSKNGCEFELEYDDDGYIEKKVKFPKHLRGTANARIRLTSIGVRSTQPSTANYGKETYDSKRDSYHGYDVSTNAHMERLQSKFQKREELRRQLKQQNNDNSNTENNDDDKNGEDSDREEDEFGKYGDDGVLFTSRLARQGGVGGAQMKMTARNLRIREDTAKYLRNLDLNSSYYDPKSRSMRQDPNSGNDDGYKGDNEARLTGDAIQFAKTQVFAWDQSSSNTTATAPNPDDTNSTSIHVQANPSQTELLRKQTDSKSLTEKQKRRQAILQKYGGQEYLDASSTEQEQQSNNKNKVVRFGVQFQEQQYHRDGTATTNTNTQVNTNVKQTSKYEEDIYINNHTTVWGSYFHRAAFRWGYADDHSLLRNSYGTGTNGQKANDHANEQQYGSTTPSNGSAELHQARQMLSSTLQQQNPPNDDDNRKRKYITNINEHHSDNKKINSLNKE